MVYAGPLFLPFFRFADPSGKEKARTRRFIQQLAAGWLPDSTKGGQSDRLTAFLTEPIYFPGFPAAAWKQTDMTPAGSERAGAEAP